MESGGAGEAKVITASDIDKAKGEITASAKKAAVAALKQGLEADRKIFDDSANVEVLSVAMSDNAGAEKEKISATAKVRASVLSFSQLDVKEMLKNDLARQGASEGAISFDEPINYILSDFDNQQKTLKFSAKADANAISGIDIENFKKGILGKTNEEAQNYAKNFPAIQKTDISFWPFFASRIPMNGGRVDVEVK
jgi:pyruvate/2-oxoglutarate dehydrogenase complex dihydrolipoamide acyltransferase (E2) component